MTAQTKAGILNGFTVNRENLSTPGTFDLKIGRIFNVQLPQMTAETQDVTDSDSPDGFREFIGALRDGGEVTLEFNFRPTDAGQAQLRTDFESGTQANYEIALPAIGDDDPVSVQFCATITALSPPSGAIEDKMTGSVSFKVSGKPAWTNWAAA